jgi:hypothetical protein
VNAESLNGQRAFYLFVPCIFAAFFKRGALPNLFVPLQQEFRQRIEGDGAGWEYFHTTKNLSAKSAGEMALTGDSL